MTDEVLNMKNISKAFPGVLALDNVNFDLKKGEVHALLGENGAGKSTLIKILSGLITLDSGAIYINGKTVDIKDINDSAGLGISTIHQELVLAGNMCVADNIYMGREFTTKKLCLVDNKMMRAEAQKILDRIGVNIDPLMKVSNLSTAQQQVVEIAKALSVNAQIMVMDEPTSSLTKHEVEKLLRIVENLKNNGVSVIYISHRLEEIFSLADRVTVLRDGKYIGTKDIHETSRDELIKMMVGREVKKYYSHHKITSEETIFEVRNLTTVDKLKNVSLELKKGEILGISGLVGAGRTELAKAIFGIDSIKSGEIYLEGKRVNFKSPSDAIKNGIVLVPESRKEQGLILIKDVGFNITLCVLESFMKLIKIDKNKQKELISDSINRLSIKTYSDKQEVSNLSGGNQQKVVIAKWLATKPKVLILDEPTRGIDVGAKAEIYKIMNDLASSGVSIIMISSELPEIINMSDRVYIMHEGEIAGCLEKEEIDQERIISYAVGVN